MAPNPRSILFYENEDVERLDGFIKKGFRTKPIFFVNGSRVDDALAARARPNQTLISFLRNEMKLTGTKLGCSEGGCGACTVMISKTGANNGGKIQ
jgi:xanthine dehydrogenase iron-sulfur cluster and FAD-binding subunit A